MGAPGMMDGTLVTTITLNPLPTSRGTVTLKSPDPTEHPVIDHKHFSTEKDRFCFRTGARKFLDFMNTDSGKEIAIGEFVAPGREPLNLGAQTRRLM
jgi:choline dehydrogenase-like flavoprotein